MLHFIRSVFARLAAHPVCEACESGMARDLDAILDALMVDPEVDTDADPWARIVEAREVAYRLRMDFDHLGAYVPGVPTGRFERGIGGAR